MVLRNLSFTSLFLAVLFQCHEFYALKRLISLLRLGKKPYSLFYLFLVPFFSSLSRQCSAILYYGTKPQYSIYNPTPLLVQPVYSITLCMREIVYTRIRLQFLAYQGPFFSLPSRHHASSILGLYSTMELSLSVVYTPATSLV